VRDEMMKEGRRQQEEQALVIRCIDVFDCKLINQYKRSISGPASYCFKVLCHAATHLAIENTLSLAR
jgi:hypothetical protein